MRFARSSSIFLLTSMVLTGCSSKLQVALFNDAGEAVTVKMEGANIALEPGQSGQFDYPGDEQNWMLHVSTAICDYAYQVPKTGSSGNRVGDFGGS